MAGWISASLSSSSSSSPSVTSRRVTSGPTTPTHGVRRITSEGHVYGEPVVVRGRDNGNWNWYESLVASWVHREQVPPTSTEPSSTRFFLPELPYAIERVVAAMVSMFDRALRDIRRLFGMVTELQENGASTNQRVAILEETLEGTNKRQTEHQVTLSDTYYQVNHLTELVKALTARVAELELAREAAPPAPAEPVDEPIVEDPEEEPEEDPEEEPEEDPEEEPEEEMPDASSDHDSS